MILYYLRLIAMLLLFIFYFVVLLVAPIFTINREFLIESIKELNTQNKFTWGID